MNNKYKIHYSHRAPQEVSNLKQALGRVSLVARVDKLATVTVPDGIYCYLSQEDTNRDDTGEGAYAVITSARLRRPANQK